MVWKVERKDENRKNGMQKKGKGGKEKFEE
jgi:hypothetical protein